MNEKDKLKLKKIRLLISPEEENILELSKELSDDNYYDSQPDWNYEAYLQARINCLEEVNMMLTHKIDILKNLYNSIPNEKKYE